MIEIELAPGGGNLLHYHRAFSERFEVLEGELQIQVGKESYTLKPTQSVTAHPNIRHRFFNPTVFLICTCAAADAQAVRRSKYQLQ